MKAKKKTTKTMELEPIELEPPRSMQETTVTSVSPETQMISMIERMAMNPEVDVDKLERLMAMNTQMLDRQAEQEYTRAMVKVQQGLRGVTRDKHNPQTHSNYPSLEAMKKAVVPAYTAEGFAVSYGEGVTDKPDHIRVTCKVMHIAGHSEPFYYDCPIDDKGMSGKVNKTLTHGKASAITYGERYILKLIFNITIQDEDDDGNASGPMPVISDDEALILESLISDNEINPVKFSAWMRQALKCDSISSLNATGYKTAIERVNSAIRAQSK